MYNAQVIPVMIASPSDVQAERDLVREIIFGWNYTDSFRNSLVVLPVGWETHSSPDLSMGAQDQINERLVDRCDILVGIFWTRLGSPTKNEKSGTVEEVKRFLAAGKPVMLYFSDQPVALSSVDPKQYEALQEFKSWAQSQGMYQPFISIEDFRQEFERQFRQCIYENPHVRSAIEEFRAVKEAATEAVKEQAGGALQTVPISDEALALLGHAAAGNGIVGLHDYLSGTHFTAGSFQVETDGTGREAARWRAAVETLSTYGLIEERKLGSGVYFVTHEGFETIERNASVIEEAKRSAGPD